MTHDPGGRRKPRWPPDSVVTAEFSDCERYRYCLSEVWETGRPLVMFLMMNPSVAGPEHADPTLIKTGKYARAWGYGGQLVGNVQHAGVDRQRSPRRSRRSGGAEERRGSAPHGAKSRGRCSRLWPAPEASASARSHRDRDAARDGSAEVPAQDEERDALSSAVPARRPTADRLHRLTVPPAANEPADFRRQTAVGPSRLQLLKDCQA